MKNKEFSRNNLFKFYYISPLFKRYCRFGLWFGSLEEFNNIRYCEKYLQEYARSRIKNNLLCYVETSSDLTLAIDYYIIKFLESRFFCYINLHFLLCFYNNSFLFSFVKSKIKIETFVNYYYENFLEKKLEKDFLSYVIKSTNILGQNFSKVYLKKEINKLKKTKSLKKNIQILFESTDSFGSFKRKKESIGFHSTLNVVYK